MLALIGLIGAMVAAGAVRVVEADHPSPEDTFWQACRSAEKMAALSERNVTLTFDTQKRELTWSNGVETEHATFDPAGGDVTVQFIQPQAGGSRILIAGQVVETQEIPHVIFYPDGTCTAFQVQFRANKHTWQIAIDPWTCAPILEKKAEEAGS